MGKMICLMGKSSTGKDTIFKRLLECEELELHTLIPYTTRPLRDGEEDGVEYHFTDEEGFQEILKDGKVIEERSYDTYHGTWRYFTVDDDGIDLAHKNYIIIGTLESYCKMCRFFGKNNVVALLIEVDDGVRLQRALDREKNQDNPKYEEMCRRFLADSEDFRDDKMKEADINQRFSNVEIENCLIQIKEYLQEVCSL